MTFLCCKTLAVEPHGRSRSLFLHLFLFLETINNQDYKHVTVSRGENSKYYHYNICFTLGDNFLLVHIYKVSTRLGVVSP